MKRLLTIIFIFLSNYSQGSHIVGGEFELNYICPSTYGLRLVLYFDELNGFEELQDQEVYAHIFRKSDNKLMQVKFLPKVGQFGVPYYQEWCDDNEVQTLKIIYGDTVILADSLYSDPEGYYVAWENCCRNYNVTNVITGSPPSPGTDPFTAPFSGQTYYLEFPPVIKDGIPFINSTPSFSPLNSYACPNVSYWANFAAKDPDGDSLVYSLEIPLDNLPNREAGITRPGPYPEVNWANGFGPANIMGGDPDLNITKNGFLSVTPVFTGLFVFAVRVVEWRDGERIGSIQREFQLYVDDLCTQTYPPFISSKLATETNFSKSEELDIIYDNTVSLDDRCINLLISDIDAEDTDETIRIELMPLNFEDEDSVLNKILPAGKEEIVLSNGNTASLDICFSECPLLDPFDLDILQFAILVFDDSCPLPLIDTLEISIQIEPPINQAPSIAVEGNHVSYYEKLVTESAGGFISFPIEGIDPDDHNLSMEIIPINNFDPLKAGMSFKEPSGIPGKISTNFSWNFDCADESLDYSEGYDTSVSSTSTIKSYDFLIIVEDEDDCQFPRADTLDIHLAIEFPGEAHPNVFIPGENPVEDYFVFEYDISETIFLDIKALDGPFDNDPLRLFAVGYNYDFENFGASFAEVNGGSGLEPGTQSTFIWPLKCDKIILQEQDTFRTHFIVNDIDVCNLANSDTLTVDFVLFPSENTAPDLRIQNIAGEQAVENDSLRVDISKRVKFNLVGDDADEDSLNLRLLYINGALPPEALDFENTSGKGSISATFSLELDCNLLGDNYSEANYQFAFLLEDFNCSKNEADTLLFSLIVNDTPVDDTNFLPSNVFTPNGDGINDFFGMSSYDELRNERNILPLDNCLGQFGHVSIINRYGREIYFSEDRNFKWYAEGIPSGVYFYVISYSNKVYKGNVSVLY